MSKDMPRYRIAVYTPDQTLPTMIPSIDTFGDIMAGRIEDIREVCYADGCTCFHCGTLVGGTTSSEIGENLTAHYRECEKHPLSIENRELRKALWWMHADLQAEADELRKVLWWYAELTPEAADWNVVNEKELAIFVKIRDRAIEVLQRFPGDKEKKIVLEGVQPK
jgi:hypothetical protein